MQPVSVDFHFNHSLTGFDLSTAKEKNKMLKVTICEFTLLLSTASFKPSATELAHE